MLINTCKSFFDNPDNISLNWEHLMNLYLKDNIMNAVMTESNYFIEIDTPKDFYAATTLFTDIDLNSI